MAEAEDDSGKKIDQAKGLHSNLLQCAVQVFKANPYLLVNCSTKKQPILEAHVPPLEDMTDILNTFSNLKTKENSTESNAKQPINQFLEISEPNEEISNVKRIEKLFMKEKEAERGQQKESVNENSNKIKQPATFGGFKKGFLLGKQEQKCQKSASTKEKNIEELKPISKERMENPLVFSDVQEALASQMPLLKSKEWITEDLLSKLQKNPKLFKQLQDPRFSQALASFQSNPQQSMLAFHNDPELQEFIRNFCAIMGEHFTTLEDKNKTQKKSEAENFIKPVASSRKANLDASKAPQTTSDEKKMQAILSNPEVQKILAKPKIQHLISAMQNNPTDSQRFLSTFTAEDHRDVQRLVEVGLLGISRK
eukprot:gene304-932_t